MGDIINNYERYFFLLIRRKDTLGYVEFLRGKYEEKNEDYLVKIFQTMTKGEIERIKTLEFSKLWNELWSHRNYKQYQTEFENSKIKFLNLKNNVYLKLDDVIRRANTQFEEKEWGFPKDGILRKRIMIVLQESFKRKRVLNQVNTGFKEYKTS